MVLNKFGSDSNDIVDSVRMGLIAILKKFAVSSDVTTNNLKK